MSADAFYFCYGVQRTIDSRDESSIELLELKKHPWQILAQKYKLRISWGETADEQNIFVLISKQIYHLGAEGASEFTLKSADAMRTAIETDVLLKEAGFHDEAAWHFQYVPDY
jgi:hypothetical protein